MAHRFIHCIFTIFVSLSEYVGVVSSGPMISNRNAKTGVLYIKTYKTASSTMSAILYRYGFENNLTSWKGIFMHCNPQIIGSFNVVAGHNYCGRKGCTIDQKRRDGGCKGLGYQSWLEEKMLTPFVRLVMVAEPKARLISSYFYRRLQNQHGDKSGVEEKNGVVHGFSFDENDLISYAKKEFANDRDAVQWHWLADSTQNGTLNAVLSTIVPQFIVGLTNRFDESLILLREALGVSSRSILYANLKVTESGTKKPKFDSLSTQAQEVISQVIENTGDDVFYAKMLEVFDRQVFKIGTARMRSELAAFQSLRGQMQQACTDVYSEISPSAKTSNNPRYVIRDPRTNCLLKKYDERISVISREIESV